MMVFSTIIELYTLKDTGNTGNTEDILKNDGNILDNLLIYY